MATSTTVAGSKRAQKWHTTHVWKWPFAIAPNPTTWTSVYCGILTIYAWVQKSTFLLFYNHQFQNLSQIVFHFIKKAFDASGFPVIMSSLCFTNNESKWARNPVVPVFGATCFKLKFGGLQTDILSSGLRIHECHSRDRCSNLLKVPKISSRGAFIFPEAVFFARILQELFRRVVLNFNHFELKNITFNQKILFSNAVLDLLNHSGFLVWISPISAASRLWCFLTLLSQMWPLFEGSA